ncbi:transporter substrate-binding domain-containing protein, partial [Thiolapillus sp.]
MNQKACQSHFRQAAFRHAWQRAVCSSLLFLAFMFAAGTPAFSDTVNPIAFLEKPFSEDLPKMKQRRTVRALVVYGPTDFFFDKGKPSGIQVDLLREYEKFLNKGIKREAEKIHVAFLPVPFGRLIPDLLAGKGDIAAHFLTETDERKQKLLFASGRKTTVDELVVTHKDQAPLEDIDGLAGKTVYVLPHSSYLEHLRKLNADFKSRGLKLIDIQTVDSHLSSENVLEMVNAGIIGMTVIDDHKARLWAKVLPDIRVQENLAVSRGNYLVPVYKCQVIEIQLKNRNKRVFDLVIDFGTSQSPKSTRPLTTYLCPSRPGHQALRN